jgi:hypothetical protein
LINACPRSLNWFR